jgi:hypothetical protein
MRRFLLAVCIGMTAAAAFAQTGPVKEAAKVPSGDAILGHYQFKSGVVMSIERSGEVLTVESTGQQAQALTALANGQYSYASGQASLSFDLDSSGKGKTLHLHFDERTLPATRINDAAAKKVSDALELKIKNQTHDPACATTLKRLVEEIRIGKPDYSKMTLLLGQATRTQLPMMQSKFQELGALKDVNFISVGPMGAEQFDVAFEKGATQWRIFCLPNGYVGSAAFR